MVLALYQDTFFGEKKNIAMNSQVFFIIILAAPSKFSSIPTSPHYFLIEYHCFRGSEKFKEI